MKLRLELGQVGEFNTTDKWEAEILNNAHFITISTDFQGVVTPIGAVLMDETGDTTRSPGHGGFFLSVTGSLRFIEASHDPLEGRIIA